MCTEFVKRCAKQGIVILITSTYRDNESQAALYAQGRTSEGHIVTKAKPGHSFHNFKVAFDFVPIVHGKADYQNIATFERCGIIAEACGLEWAGRWVSFKELAHCQFTGGLTLAQFRAGATLASVFQHGPPQEAA
jgi:peptidoglycan L-alanyl-D-glutamate endopeptidase CwlK